MSTPSAKETIAAFVRVVRQKLERGESVTVPGFGTFSIVHHPSEMKKNADGDDYMAPPRDVVEFTPER